MSVFSIAGIVIQVYLRFTAFNIPFTYRMDLNNNHRKKKIIKSVIDKTTIEDIMHSYTNQA
jgi:hypothetical protein